MSTLEPGVALSLAVWENFYEIVGSSAAALTGLTFIVITISSDRGTNRPMAARARLLGLRAFIAPTVVHFGSALGVSALLSVPGQTTSSLAVCLAAGGLAGVVYAGYVLYWMRQMSADYQAFVADWLWNVVLPLLAYLSLWLAAALLLLRAAAALYVIAAVALALLFVGIRNAWDVVAWITTERDARHERAHERKGLAQRTASPPPQSSSESAAP